MSTKRIGKARPAVNYSARVEHHLDVVFHAATVAAQRGTSEERARALLVQSVLFDQLGIGFPPKVAR